MGVDAKLLKTYVVEFPAVQFVGKRYLDDEKKDDSFAWLWDIWFEKNQFEPIEALIKKPDFVEAADSYYGMHRIRKDGTYEYWIGMIVPLNAKVPRGYSSFSIPACKPVVSWIYGKEPDVYFVDCRDEMEARGFKWNPGPSGDRLMAERYACPRFTEPDQNGNIILDAVYFTDYLD